MYTIATKEIDGIYKVGSIYYRPEELSLDDVDNNYRVVIKMPSKFYVKEISDNQLVTKPDPDLNDRPTLTWCPTPQDIIEIFGEDEGSDGLILRVGNDSIAFHPSLPRELPEKVYTIISNHFGWDKLEEPEEKSLEIDGIAICPVKGWYCLEWYCLLPMYYSVHGDTEGDNITEYIIKKSGPLVLYHSFKLVKESGKIEVVFNVVLNDHMIISTNSPLQAEQVFNGISIGLSTAE